MYPNYKPWRTVLIDMLSKYTMYDLEQVLSVCNDDEQKVSLLFAILMVMAPIM